MRPHSSHSSRENATPSSGTSPLASCKGVPSPLPWGLNKVAGTQKNTYQSSLFMRVVQGYSRDAGLADFIFRDMTGFAHQKKLCKLG